MWQALIGPASDLLGGWLKSKAETKAAETRVKVAKAEAEAEVMKVATTHEARWKKSWRTTINRASKMSVSLRFSASR